MPLEWNCVTTGAYNQNITGNIWVHMVGTTTDCTVTASSSFLYTQDIGNVSFGLAIITTMLVMVLTAMIFNTLKGKKI